MLRAARRIDSKNTTGYFAVKLTAPDGKRFSTSAHRVQWIANNGPIPEGKEVNHKDRNKANNRLDNLELVTRGENIRHAVKLNGGSWVPAGDKCYKAKLTWEQVRHIRAEVDSGRATQAAMAEKFGVNPVTISLIISRKQWKPRNDPMNKASD